MISIIIPTYNEEKYLPKLLNSINKQTYKNYEVIVADANSKDKTVEVAKKFGAKVVKGGRPARGRNAGAAVAKGEYLLFLDSDVILPYNCLEKALRQFNREYFDVSSIIPYPISKKEVDKTAFQIQRKLMINLKSFFPFTAGYAIFVTKRLHRRIGGFDEQRDLSEDNDYGLRARKFGKYDAIDDTYIKVSVRRFDKEGREVLIKKYLKYVFYDQLKNFGIKHNKTIEYEFGNFEKINKSTKLEEELENFLKYLNKLFK